MAQTHLTAAYRPQLFSQVVGQEAVTQILSRAAGEGRVAPAYMFSGTRGVGKTTVARILAKAINCSQGPGTEPCNTCEYCRQITQGTSLDVAEIDGASHTGVDHVRKLTEDVSYAPLHCRYKVVIIDEAHMLSRSAFNALLKTLEEPPGHVCFILATTEPHKFPATIVSRCQHLVFKRVEQQVLEAHMGWILEEQGMAYEASALRVLARKGGGSVRDCLSLLGQVMALGQEEISTPAVQSLLGLAGQELMQECVQSLADKDCAAVVNLVRQLLDQGLDIGFFLQDLALAWRNLFILKQTGEQGIPLLDMPEEEARQWLERADAISMRQIHAAWQMTLEGQRRVVSSPDPALALELMLMNLAFLPELVGVGQEGGSAPSRRKKAPGSQAEGKKRAPGGTPEAGPASGAERESGNGASTGSRDWEGFLASVRARKDKPLSHLHLIQGHANGSRLELYCPGYMAQRLQDRDKVAWLQERAEEYFGSRMEIRVCRMDQGGTQNQQEGKKKILNEPMVQEAIERFAARIVDVQTEQADHGSGPENG
jgi:DNA polymerase-3 subunit gamma/tau